MLKTFYISGLIAVGIIAIPFFVGAALFGGKDFLWMMGLVLVASLFYYVVFASLPLYVWYKVFLHLSDSNRSYYPIYTSGLYVLIIAELVVVIGGFLYSWVTGYKYVFGEVASLVLVLVPGYLLTSFVLKKVLQHNNTLK